MRVGKGTQLEAKKEKKQEQLGGGGRGRRGRSLGKERGGVGGRKKERNILFKIVRVKGEGERRRSKNVKMEERVNVRCMMEKRK